MRGGLLLRNGLINRNMSRQANRLDLCKKTGTKSLGQIALVATSSMGASQKAKPLIDAAFVSK